MVLTSKERRLQISSNCINSGEVLQLCPFEKGARSAEQTVPVRTYIWEICSSPPSENYKFRSYYILDTVYHLHSLFLLSIS